MPNKRVDRISTINFSFAIARMYVDQCEYMTYVYNTYRYLIFFHC